MRNPVEWEEDRVFGVAAEAHAKAEPGDQEARQCHVALGEARLIARVRGRRVQPQREIHDEEAKVLHGHHRDVEENLRGEKENERHN